MTGISRALLEPVSRVTGSVGPNTMPFPQVPDIRRPRPHRVHEALGTAPLQSASADSPSTWGLLLPICSRGKAGGDAQCWAELLRFRDTLLQTVEAEDRAQMRVIVGIDMSDVVYDTKESKARLEREFAGFGSTEIQMFPPAYRGKLCWIWDALARTAVEDLGADYFVLLGDDIEMLTPGWNREIEQQFASIAADTSMPHGLACVAFRDLAFPVFPTFPVMHRRHMDVFGRLFPCELVNQHGDPYLFEIYRRYGASLFAPTAQLRNKVGGLDKARYVKQSVAWRDELLSAAISTLSGWLERQPWHGPPPARYACIDVVVPTYRCDVRTLRGITELSCGGKASVQALVVVDRPDAESLHEIVGMQSYAAHRLVRVVVQPANVGASETRNKGLSQCFGDYAVLLDDDVVPRGDLLDAYLGAILRHPHAKIFVGLTPLAPARLPMEHAMSESRMTFFYTVATHMKHPPWGVTANLCVQSRRNNAVWFSSVYPRTGGGEDVDFCIRLKANTREAVVAVPGAVAVHPYWRKILRQVAGWARGDVLCLDKLPHLAFYSLPNWAEWIVLSLLYASFQSAQALALPAPHAPLVDAWCSFGHTVVRVACVHVLCRLGFNAVQDRDEAVAADAPRSAAARAAVRVLAVVPEMVQDVVRATSKIRRLRLNQVCMNLDWLDGQGGQREATHLFLGTFNLALLAVSSTALHGPLVDGLDVRHLSVALLLPVVTALALSPEGRRSLIFRNIFRRRAPKMAFLSEGIQPFVILSHQRCGSNLLCGLLNSHPEVAMHNELFHDQRVFSYRWSVPPKWSAAERDKRPLDFLVEALTGPGALRSGSPNGPKASGFKLFPEHWRRSEECHAAFDQLLGDERVKKVILVRESRLHTCVSMMRAGATGHYNVGNLDDVPVIITPPEYQRFVDAYDSTFDYYRAHLSGQRVCTITYEALTGERGDEHVQRLLRFIGVQEDVRLLVNPSTVRQTLRPVREGITNYDELKYAFKLTKYSVDFD